MKTAEMKHGTNELVTELQDGVEKMAKQEKIRWHGDKGGGFVYDQDGVTVCEVNGFEPYTSGEQSKANAEFIVRAVNSHDALVAALEMAVGILDGLDDGAANQHEL